MVSILASGISTLQLDLTAILIMAPICYATNNCLILHHLGLVFALVFDFMGGICRSWVKRTTLNYLLGL